MEPEMYFKGDVNYLTAEQAKDQYPANETTRHIDCRDGTVRVVFLSEKPMYPGQTKFE